MLTSPIVDTTNNTRSLICVKKVRAALKWLHLNKLCELAQSPLIEINVVAARRQAAGYPCTSEGKAKALFDVLRDALDALKPPGQSEPSSGAVFEDLAWRPYLILTKQYVRGSGRWWIRHRMHIGDDTYLHSQNAALKTMVRWLGVAEESATFRMAQLQIAPDADDNRDTDEAEISVFDEPLCVALCRAGDHLLRQGKLLAVQAAFEELAKGAEPLGRSDLVAYATKALKRIEEAMTKCNAADS